MAHIQPNWRNYPGKFLERRRYQSLHLEPTRSQGLPFAKLSKPGLSALRDLLNSESQFSTINGLTNNMNIQHDESGRLEQLPLWSYASAYTSKLANPK